MSFFLIIILLTITNSTLRKLLLTGVIWHMTREIGISWLSFYRIAVHGRLYVTRHFLFLERYIPITTFVFLLLLLCVDEACGQAVMFFSPRCHIMPKWAHVPWKTVEWPSHLCEIWSHCVSTTSHTQFRWLGMVKCWCIAPP